jgi:predicted nucleic-acid-binding Zn-ribbon protein
MTNFTLEFSKPVFPTDPAKPITIWRDYSYDLTKCADIARYVAREKYAFPGGYELFAVTDDGGVLCHRCCKSEYYLIRTSYKGDGWHVEAMSSTAEVDDDALYCDHCGYAVFYLSIAVELFASSLEEQEDWETDDPIDLS